MLSCGVHAAPTVFKVNPSATQGVFSAAEPPHFVAYDAAAHNAPLLVWLPGTGGEPVPGPRYLYDTALSQGYRVVGLYYIDEPAVAQVCKGAALRRDRDCAQKFRQKRVFGDDVNPLIADRPEDAIVNRLERLIRYLAANDARGNWGQYLTAQDATGVRALKWDRIALAGQSQGGGMAAYLPKHVAVRRVITFSGGWDYSAPNQIAHWYRTPAATPPERWFGTYHADEPTAAVIAASYDAMGIPKSQQFALNLPVPPGKKPHGQGIANPAYRDLWIKALAGN